MGLAEINYYRLSNGRSYTSRCKGGDLQCCQPRPTYLSGTPFRPTEETGLGLDPLNLIAPCGIVPYVIILDELDETLLPDDQRRSTVSPQCYIGNIMPPHLICCRPEPTIVTVNETDSPLNAISLNDDVDSDVDIRTFLVEKFARIFATLLACISL
jgi:hypothetical protein